MISRVKYFVCFLVVLLSGVVHSQVLTPEVSHRVTFSNQDINRIVCETGNINDVYFSQEKAISVATEGRNAYLKYLVKDTGQEKIYVSASDAIYVSCAGDVYTLIATPSTKAGAQTVYLGNPVKSKIESNIENFAPLDLEERAVYLTKKVMMDDEPDSFSQIPLNKEWFDFLPKLKVRPVKKVMVEGLGLNLVEYDVAVYEDMVLEETSFLSSKLSPNIFAVTIFPLSLGAGQTARLFIVEKENQR